MNVLNKFNYPQQSESQPGLPLLLNFLGLKFLAMILNKEYPAIKTTTAIMTY